MGIVVKNISTSDSVVKSNGGRAKSQLDYIDKGEDHEKVERVWHGNTMGTGRIGDAELVACVESNVRATNPTRHLIISWRSDEAPPDKTEFDGAVRNVLNELNLANCLYKAAVHRDTDNVHLHLIVCTVDPENSRMRHTPMIEDRCQKVIARHNHEFSRANHPGDRYVMVNIPAAQIEAVEGNRVAQRHTAIVGKIDRQSPILQTKIPEVNFNPTWTVPASIIRKDLIPKMQKDANYINDYRIRIYD